MPDPPDDREQKEERADEGSTDASESPLPPAWPMVPGAGQRTTGPPRTTTLTGPVGFQQTVPPSGAQQAGASYWYAQQKKAEDEVLRVAREQTAPEKLPPRFDWASFEVPELQSRVARKGAITEASLAIGEPRVVLTGRSGSGKTSLAAAMFRARYIIRGGSVSFEPAWRLGYARSRHPLGQGEPDIICRVLEAEVLVLDDFGSENKTHTIDDIIYERHWMARTTWITTALSRDDIAERYGDSIVRHVFDHAVVIHCDQPSNR